MPVRASPRTGRWKDPSSPSSSPGPSRSASASVSASASPAPRRGGGAPAAATRPSRLSLAESSAPSTRASSPLTPATPSSPAPPETEEKGKGKARAPDAASGRKTERRVLPARIRRVAGGSNEGIRELEEMVVDWLERWGDVNSAPPEDLPLRLTTLPLALVRPATYCVEAAPTLDTAPPAPAIPAAGPSTSPLRTLTGGSTTAGPSAPGPSRIETPSWIMVRAGEDDKDEARDELAAGPQGSAAKRLRRGPVGTEAVEDTSDAYYEQLHRKFEVFERRQRIREREKLQFERYKMRARIELLRNLPSPQWGTVVTRILERADTGDGWERGRRKLEVEGADWLRRRLIREGVEVLKRYDQLLPNPNETKKQQTLPGRESSVESLSPPPPIHEDEPPAPKRRALKDAGPSRTSSLRREPKPSSPAQPSPKLRIPALAARPPPKPAPKGPPPKLIQTKIRLYTRPLPPPDAGTDSSLSEAEPTPSSSYSPVVRLRLTTSASATASPAPAVSPVKAKATPVKERTSTSPQRPLRPLLPSRPPSTSTGLPCLIEAAQRRENAIVEASAASATAAASSTANGASDSPKRRKSLTQKTRGSTRIVNAAPFGIPFPAALETKSEFSLVNEAEFWPIISAREEHASKLRRESMSSNGLGNGHARVKPEVGMRQPLPPPSASSGTGSSRPEDAEAADMEGVEAAVVL